MSRDLVSLLNAAVEARRKWTLLCEKSPLDLQGVRGAYLEADSAEEKLLDAIAEEANAPSVKSPPTAPQPVLDLTTKAYHAAIHQCNRYKAWEASGRHEHGAEYSEIIDAERVYLVARGDLLAALFYSAMKETGQLGPAPAIFPVADNGGAERNTTE